MAKTYEHAQSVYNKEVAAASKRMEAYNIRKQAMDYAMDGLSGPEAPFEIIARATAFEKYLRDGVLPKAKKK